ncbi:hypothetical protein SOVF_113130 [Spinacia oleracea]|uniref:22.0 kDa heat shock protein-like n=1 Tax=Spinacia oleracea TaxID=3562 RepID=A0ABM3R2L4_SPIOL|nr:22.0 kDa heat shock protein-like [Spinacia oleracea]KNA13764.1 hypothetical protein SOVF_113130 [Spinacia oleracea]
MANKTKFSVPASPCYVDFNPACDLQKEEGLETLIIHLPDFKKTQLRVQVSKEGVLKVSGERPTSADGAKRSRFLKETKIPVGCDMNDIRAKFTDESLHVIMPKKVTPQQPASTETAPPQQEVTDQKPEAEAAMVSDDKKAKVTSTENGTMVGTSSSYAQPKGDRMFEYGSIRKWLQGREKVTLGFGIAVVTMVAIGAFVASKYASNSNNSCSLSLYMEESGFM